VIGRPKKQASRDWSPKEIKSPVPEEVLQEPGRRMFARCTTPHNALCLEKGGYMYLCF
jgi:hypothetical protein